MPNFSLLPVLVAGLLMLGASGCENYFGDTTPIATDRLPASNQLVVGAAFTTLDSVLYLRTDRALDLLVGYPFRDGIEGNWPVVDEDDLQITLREGEVTLASFNHIPEAERYNPENGVNDRFYSLSNNYEAPGPPPELIAGRTYSLRVDHPDLGRFEIDQTMPEAVTAATATAERTLVLDPTGARAQRVRVSFADRAGQENYYLVRALTNISTDDPLGPATLYDQDPRTEEPRIPESFLLFSDDGADGQPIRLDFTASLVFWDLGQRVRAVELTAITPEWFAFVSSYLRYETLRPDLNDGFVEPFRVYTNVPDGFGYFLLGNGRRFFVD